MDKEGLLKPYLMTVALLFCAGKEALADNRLNSAMIELRRCGNQAMAGMPREQLALDPVKFCQEVIQGNDLDYKGMSNGLQQCRDKAFGVSSKEEMLSTQFDIKQEVTRYSEAGVSEDKGSEFETDDEFQSLDKYDETRVTNAQVKNKLSVVRTFNRYNHNDKLGESDKKGGYIQQITIFWPNGFPFKSFARYYDETTGMYYERNVLFDFNGQQLSSYSTKYKKDQKKECISEEEMTESRKHLESELRQAQEDAAKNREKRKALVSNNRKTGKDVADEGGSEFQRTGGTGTIKK